MSSTLSLQMQADEKKKIARDALDKKKKEEKEAIKQAKKAEKDKIKAEEKAKKQSEKEAKKLVEKVEKKKEEKKGKINGKKLVSLIENQKLLLLKLSDEGTKEELIELTQKELGDNLDLLNIYLKQEKKQASNSKNNNEVKNSQH